MKCVAKTLEGLEDVLFDEIEKLGGKDPKKGKRHVSFETDMEGLYRINYNVRTAMSILTPIARARVTNPEELYKFAMRIKWDKYLNVERTFAIRGSVHSEYFNHSQYAALKVKDAVADYFRKYYGSRPNVEKEYPDIRIDLHIDRDFATISLDSSGASLFKRGYRKNTGQAPINEVLAAGLIQLSDWDQKSPFLDPMCGSGTLAIEAFMAMCNIPSGICRLRFGFHDWYDFDKALWKKVKEESDANIIEPVAEIKGSDIQDVALENSRKNQERMPGGEHIIFTQEDFLKTKIAPGTTMMMNPPYDHRIGQTNIIEFYEKLGSQLKKNANDSTAWIFSGNIDGMKKIGLKASRRFYLLNGNIPCKFHKFEMYIGSKKIKKTVEETPLDKS